MSKPNTKKNLDLYQQLYQAFCVVHDHLTGQQCQEQFIKKWKTITVSENRSVEAEKYWKELTAAITVKRYSPGSIVNLFAKTVAKASSASVQFTVLASVSEHVNEIEFLPGSSHFVERSLSESEEEAISNSLDNSNPSASKSSKTPAQNAIKTKLEVMNSE